MAARRDMSLPIWRSRVCMEILFQSRGWNESPHSARVLWPGGSWNEWRMPGTIADPLLVDARHLVDPTFDDVMALAARRPCYPSGLDC